MNGTLKQEVTDTKPVTQPKQANVLPSANGTSQGTRHRASVACASCRDRRIRCVVPEGQQECTQCERSGTTCIIRNDDERRRPISKAYTSSLVTRISMLETLLAEKGADVPPAEHPPKRRQPPTESVESNTERGPTSRRSRSTSGSGREDSIMNTVNNNIEERDNNSPRQTTQSPDTSDGQPLSRVHTAPKEGGLVSKLLSTRGHLSFDQLSGRLRFFGATTNYHIYAESPGQVDSREPPEQVRRTERIIRSLTEETHDYLMGLFWEYYNSVLHIVHQEAFNEDRENSNNKFYSGFLHISILAMGYRFADLEREDMKKITLANRECTLHREAKYMLDIELERPGGIPSIQAFLLLGDLETGVGRDNTGWMYAGMANRLCFDIGLHLDCQNDGLSEKEAEIRHMTLLACVAYDRYWALFLGRPTSIKTADLEMYHLSRQFASLGACKPAGPKKALETRIYEELLALMELAGKIAEIKDSPLQSSEGANNDAYLHVMDLDRQLQSWYRRLPDSLVWKPANINTAPFSYFLLHQQYHCSLILLHRPWAKYQDPPPPDAEEGDDENFMKVDDNHSSMSRSICTRQAIRIARIFWHHRQRFDTRKIFVTGIQHAGTAATALVAALAFIKNIDDRKNNMQYLECLASSLQDMGYTYQPAASMSQVLHAVIEELNETNSKASPDAIPLSLNGPGTTLPEPLASIPARRESSSVLEDRHVFKKHQSGRPSASATPRRHTSSTSDYTSSSTRSTLLTPSTPRVPPFFDHDHHSVYGGNDGFVMVTPRSETASWPSLNSDPNALDYPMTTFGMSMNAEGMWMGADAMSPFLHSGMGDTGMEGGGGGVGKHNLDFFEF